MRFGVIVKGVWGVKDCFGLCAWCLGGFGVIESNDDNGENTKGKWV
jgi:hypothetical protein